MQPEDKVLSAIPVFAPHVARLAIKDMDPAYHYRWVANNQDRIDFMKDQMGYEFVTRKDTEPGTDSRRIVGTSVLMRCPRELYEKREHIRRLRSRQMLAGPRDKVKTTAENLGVEATDHTREYRGPLSSGMQDTKDDAARGEGTITRADLKQFNPSSKE